MRQHSTYCQTDHDGTIVQIFETGAADWVIARYPIEMDIAPIELAAAYQAGILIGVVMTTADIFDSAVRALHGGQ